MAGYPIIRSALMNNGGVVFYNDNPETHKRFGILKIKNTYFVVLIPDGKKDSKVSKFEHFHGSLWVIDIKDNLPTLTGEYRHVMNERAINLKAAIKKFNKYYSKDIIDPGEIIEVFEPKPITDNVKENNCAEDFHYLMAA